MVAVLKLLPAGEGGVRRDFVGDGHAVELETTLCDLEWSVVADDVELGMKALGFEGKPTRPD